MADSGTPAATHLAPTVLTSTPLTLPPVVDDEPTTQQATDPVPDEEAVPLLIQEETVAEADEPAEIAETTPVASTIAATATLTTDKASANGKRLNVSGSLAGLAAASAEAAAPEAADMLAAIWRYRWAVLLPALAGAFVGFLVYSRTPETFKSATRLIIESDRKPILDTMTGDLVGGVPNIEIIRPYTSG